MMKTSNHSKENGNVLVYILGAIFLLGILIVMVKGSSTPGTNIDQETLMIRVSEVQEYGQELERAVAYIMRNGHSEADIRFAHPDADSAYGDITDTPTRQVFATTGGAAKYREPPEGIQVTPTDWLFNGNNVVGRVGTYCTAGSACTDLIALLMNVTKEFCVELNKKIGLKSSATNPQQDVDSVSYANKFTGDFLRIHHILGGSASMKDKYEGCFEGDTDPAAGTYHYYRVLLAR